MSVCVFLSVSVWVGVCGCVCGGGGCMGGFGKTLSACFMFRSSKVSLKQGRGCYREVEPRNLCKEFKKYRKILEVNIENIGFRKKILRYKI